MFDLLTEDEDAVAAAQGWGLHPVFDLSSTRWHVMALPRGAGENIVQHARMGSPLHIKALRLIQAGFDRKTK